MMLQRDFFRDLTTLTTTSQRETACDGCGGLSRTEGTAAQIVLNLHDKACNRSRSIVSLKMSRVSSSLVSY